MSLQELRVLHHDLSPSKVLFVRKQLVKRRLPEIQKCILFILDICCGTDSEQCRAGHCDQFVLAAAQFHREGLRLRHGADLHGSAQCSYSRYPFMFTGERQLLYDSLCQSDIVSHSLGINVTRIFYFCFFLLEKFCFPNLTRPNL